jgi:hypothetical protein
LKRLQQIFWLLLDGIFFPVDALQATKTQQKIATKMK